MDYNKFFQQTQPSPCESRRSSFMIIKDERIMSADDYFLNESKNKALEAETHRQRSFSAGALPVSQRATKSRIPNFRRFHEQQFEKMESISDYTARKAERARKLLTPPRLMVQSGIAAPPSPPKPAFKRTLSVNYKNSNEAPSKRIKVDTAVRLTSPSESIRSSICSKTASWLKGVKLNRRFQLLLNSQKNR